MKTSNNPMINRSRNASLFLHCARLVPLFYALFLLAALLPLHAQTERRYVFATANTGGTYYPVGVALATLTKIKLEPKHRLSLSAVSSAGSGENLAMLENGSAQFAILQGIYGSWAWNGTGRFRSKGAQTHLRSITMLWQNVEHFILQSDYVLTGNVDDLGRIKGKPFGIGEHSSGSAGSGLHILQRLGFDPARDFLLQPLTYGESAVAIQDGTIAGMNIPGGPPVEAVRRAYRALGKDITVLAFTAEQLAKINNSSDLWASYRIPANTYPGQDQPITTIAQPNFLAVHADVSEEDVYLIVKTIYNNLNFLNNIHQATTAMSLERAIDGLPVPLHPGAARFYRENGLQIADRLIIR